MTVSYGLVEQRFHVMWHERQDQPLINPRPNLINFRFFNRPHSRGVNGAHNRLC